MSVLDQVRALEQQVLQRLRELRPLVDEYRDLEKVAERLGLKRDDEQATDAGATRQAEPSPRRKPTARRSAKRAARSSKPAAAAKAKPRAKSKPKPAATAKPKATADRTAKAKPKPRARKRSAAAPGQREQDVLRLVGERPGVTVAELAAELQVEATGLYGVVRRLQGKGQIIKDGTQLRAADAPASAGDGPPANSPAAPVDASVPNDEGSDQAVPEPAGASATATGS